MILVPHASHAQAPTPVTPERFEDEIDLRDVWNLLARKRLTIGVTAALVLGATAAYTLRMVPIYRAETSLRIDEESTDLPVLDVLQTLSRGSQVATEMEVLRSRTLAEDVVTELGLQVGVVRPRGVARAHLLAGMHVEAWAPEAEYRLERAGADGFRIVDDETATDYGAVSTTRAAALPGLTFRLRPGALDRDEIVLSARTFQGAVVGLVGTLAVTRPNREAGIVTVRYESTDTQLVHQVPNAVALGFIDRRQEARKTEARSAVAFLEEQLDTLRIQLTEAENALQAFREEGQVVSLEAEASAQVTQLARLQADRNQRDAERQALQALVDEIEAEAELSDPEAPSPFRRLISFPSLLTNSATSEMLRSLNELDQQKGELLQRRTLEDPDVVNLTARTRELEGHLRSIATTYLQGLVNQVVSMDRTLDRFGRELERIPGKEIQQIRLDRQRAVLEEIFTLLQTRLQEARIAQAVEDATVRIVDPAELPIEPYRPRTGLNLTLGLLIGLMLGVGIAFVREYLDDTVHTSEDIQGAAGGAPMLGIIPHIRDTRAGSAAGGRRNGRRRAPPAELSPIDTLEGRLVAGRHPRSPVTEAYRSLRTNITFASPDRPPRTLVFTSPLPRDGKTTTAANLTITMAQQGTRVLLVDADLRRGTLDAVFSRPRAPGLSNLILGTARLQEALQTVDLGDSGVLDLLCSGTHPPNPAELLGSQRMKDLLGHLEGLYDLVVLDAPPLTVVTDAAVLGTIAGGVVLVGRAAVTEKGAVTYAAVQLRNVRAPILGVVLNDVDYRRDARYSSVYGKYEYYHRDYYGPVEEAGAAGNGGRVGVTV